jgi:hypothetical protein
MIGAADDDNLIEQRATEAGTLTITVPDELRDRDLEVLVVLQPVDFRSVMP